MEHMDRWVVSFWGPRPGPGPVLLSLLCAVSLLGPYLFVLDPRIHVSGLSLFRECPFEPYPPRYYILFSDRPHVIICFIFSPNLSNTHAQFPCCHIPWALPPLLPPICGRIISYIYYCRSLALLFWFTLPLPPLSRPASLSRLASALLCLCLCLASNQGPIFNHQQQTTTRRRGGERQNGAMLFDSQPGPPRPS
ncbi:hypothetical protein EDB81DRAFT_222728 [Dactylonectria macrodidyma]|uniref:Uncharacterized protein n=1 Tax=Dactylonectria macrodidyma TaxID=307937 RepID=A0A9P9DPI8_9HYPO|nr:hypothetical protein EDB81DRAFT_222728 [Dactylonectria macrodidyma]